MATDYDITIKRYNGTDYDTLHPTVRASGIEGNVPVSKGGTGAYTAAAARANLAVYSKTEADARYLKLAGGTMTGPIQTGQGLSLLEPYVEGSKTRKVLTQDQNGVQEDLITVGNNGLVFPVGFISEGGAEIKGNLTLGTDDADMPINLEYTTDNGWQVFLTPDPSMEQVNILGVKTPMDDNAAANKAYVDAAAAAKAPAYSYGTEDLTAGQSALDEGVLYFVYE